MKHILTSLFFPFLQKISPKVSPNIGLERLENGVWKVTEDKPQFIVRSPFFNVLSGWVSIKVKIESESMLNPKLYIDFGEGYSESRVVNMSQIDESTYQAELFLPKAPENIRFDPTEEQCTFTVPLFQIQAHSEVLHFIYQFITIMKYDYKNGTDTLRIIKKSYARYKKHGKTGMLDRLYKEYRRLGGKKAKSFLPQKIVTKNLNEKSQSFDDAIGLLMEIQQFLNNKENISSSAMTIKESLIPQLIDEFRNNYNKDIFKCSVTVQDENTLKVNTKVESILDVIIPIYKNVDITQNCIESVLASNNKIKYHLILINDKSPDLGMSEMLKKYERYSHISIIENSENLGFIGSVNKGMNLHERDVVLLNSDTITTDHWLDKLYKTAYSEYNIATVTPLSNSATILSYPKTLVDNEIPEGLTAHSINEICEKVNAGLVIDLPTAHGFCMFIKRQTLFEIGQFNQEKFGQGYGEENDFSLRALSKGWRNVATCDTFIQHISSVSFADDKDAFIAKNLRIVNKIYPEYHSFVNKFINNDPLRVPRRNISKGIFKSVTSKYILSISHTRGGGTKVAVDTLAQLLMEEGEETLILEFIDNKYHLKSYHYPFSIEYHSEEWDILVQDLLDLGVWHIHYHHIIEFEWNVFLLPSLLDVEYDYSLHDYLSICPRINLINEKHEYCTEPAVNICNQCIRNNGVDEVLKTKLEETYSNIENWREKFFTFMKRARRIYVPNRDVLERIENYYPLSNVVVKEHPESVKMATVNLHRYKDNRAKVAIIGAVSYMKGFNRIYECIKDAYRRKLPIDFIIIGFTVNDEMLQKYSNVTITGRYAEEELEGLIHKYNCSISLFLNVWPETFSYTFSESLKNTLYPIAYDIGAISARIKEIGVGKVLPLDSSASLVNKCIIEMSLENINQKITIGKQYENMISDYYELR